MFARAGQRKGRASAQPAVVNETLPGAVTEWRGKLTRGQWTLYCSLPGDKKAGMRTTLTVRSSPANIGGVWPTSPPTAKPRTSTT